MYTYFAQFSPAPEGGFDVLFPDLNGAATSGETLNEALEMAQDLLRTWIETALDGKESLPVASGHEQARALAEKICREMGIPAPEGTFYQAIQADVPVEKPVRLNISFMPSVLQMVDDAARRESLTRSGFLAMAAKKYLQEVNA